MRRHPFFYVEKVRSKQSTENNCHHYGNYIVTTDVMARIEKALSLFTMPSPHYSPPFAETVSLLPQILSSKQDVAHVLRGVQ
jgi:hypothetical protein